MQPELQPCYVRPFSVRLVLIASAIQWVSSPFFSIFMLRDRLVFLFMQLLCQFLLLFSPPLNVATDART